MTAVVPKVTVTLEEGTKSPGTGEAGKIAVIGAFKTTSTSVELFTSLAQAQKAWGKMKPLMVVHVYHSYSVTVRQVF